MCREETTFFIPVVCLALLVSRHSMLVTWDTSLVRGIHLPTHLCGINPYISESDTNAANF
jgi:hypothetical protein